MSRYKASTSINCMFVPRPLPLCVELNLAVSLWKKTIQFETSKLLSDTRYVVQQAHFVR